MPFVADRRLADMVNPTAVTVAGRAMTAKGTQRLAEATRMRTPIDTAPTGGLARSRPRGTARASVTFDPVRALDGVTGKGWRGRVYTEDPVFPYIEWNTRPHVIRPTAEHRARAAAEGRTAMLRFFQNGRVRYATSVRHPGTQGQHPFARAAAFVEAEVGHMFAPELREFGRLLTEGGTSAALERTAQAVGQMDAAVQAWIRANTIRFGAAGAHGA